MQVSENQWSSRRGPCLWWPPWWGGEHGGRRLGFPWEIGRAVAPHSSLPLPPSHQHTAGSTLPPASLGLLEGWWLSPASAELQREAPIWPIPMGPVHPYLHLKPLQMPSEQNPSLSWGALLPAFAFTLPDSAGHSGRKILTPTVKMPQKNNKKSIIFILLMCTQIFPDSWAAMLWDRQRCVWKLAPH